MKEHFYWPLQQNRPLCSSPLSQSICQLRGHIFFFTYNVSLPCFVSIYKSLFHWPFSFSIFTCWDYGFRKCSWVLPKALLNKDFSLFPIICRGPDTVGFYCFTSSLLDALCTGRSVLSVSPPSDPRTDSVRDYKGSCAILVSLRGTCNVVASISPRLWGHVDG